MDRMDRSAFGGNHAEPTSQEEQLQQLIRRTVEQTLQSMSTPSHRMEASAGAQPKTIDLMGLFFFVLEKFWCVLLSALIFTAFFGWNASRAVPTYTATAKLYIVNPAGSGISIADLQLGTVLTMDYQEVFKTWEVHEMVREELQLPYSYAAMQSMLTVTNPEDTRLLYITVVNTDAQLAADIANAYARAAKEFIMNTMKGEQPSDFSIALVPGTAYVTSRTQSMLMGFMVGSVLAVGLLAVIFVLDNSPKTPEDIEKNAGIPTLALLPVEKKRSTTERRAAPENFPAAQSLRLNRFPTPDYLSAEGLNTLVTNLSYCGADVRRIMVTSRYSGEGKSYVTMNLLRSLSAMGRQVVVVDTDLRASGIQAAYGLQYANSPHNGLSEYLAGHCNADEVLYQTNIPGAWLIPAGHAVPNPIQLLDTEKMRQLIEALSERFDTVLLDTPPVGLLVDAVAMAKFCDGAIMVVGYHQGKMADIDDAVRKLSQIGCPVLGAVLNEVRFKSVSNRHYYYHSRKYAGYYHKKGRKRNG